MINREKSIETTVLNAVDLQNNAYSKLYKLLNNCASNDSTRSPKRNSWRSSSSKHLRLVFELNSKRIDYRKE